ncbi:hypothetical protein AVEN_28125-1 [Araneus ventricosus]|uniref:Uncharacterized protein n=1 Tax=Araneus ventricosus TaxID=182803 RepID=A0A4Y2MQE5_ARAVE|nr:hypothetical protein AVEN_28125-1 [Araneus ventricosus]
MLTLQIDNKHLLSECEETDGAITVRAPEKRRAKLEVMIWMKRIRCDSKKSNVRVSICRLTSRAAPTINIQAHDAVLKAPEHSLGLYDVPDPISEERFS